MPAPRADALTAALARRPHVHATAGRGSNWAPGANTPLHPKSARGLAQSKTLARCSWASRRHSKHHVVFASGVLSCERGRASHSFTVRSALADARGRLANGLAESLRNQ